MTGLHLWVQRFESQPRD